MKKEKIVFMVISMNVGGTEKSLLNLISTLPREKYDISLLLLENRGGFLNAIPEDVEIIHFEGLKELAKQLKTPPKQMILQLYSDIKLIKATKLLFLNIILKLTKDKGTYFKSLLKKHPKLNREFDIAVAYAGPMDFISYFVVNKIKAKKKVQWIHFDVTKVGFDQRFANRIYKNFDKIFVVSQEGKIKLEETMPGVKEQIEVFPNQVSTKDIRHYAYIGKGFQDSIEGVRILTVGRLAKEKGQDLAIKVLAKLIEEGCNVKWYCLGEGEARKQYETLIKEFKIQDDFILLGSDPNPYAYISQCDIYVQPSLHEGYCITLAEARLLSKPIVTSDFTGAREQIRNEETGLIVCADEEAIYTGVKRLVEDKDLREKFTDNLKQQTSCQTTLTNDYFTRDRITDKAI
ncbi:glycosyltransferase [Lentibacillus sediminis]|uniref:glycosyltransferase n=1 Tax=Lentibacillus sediminis TaxID=1940529 RepID=UPI001EFEC2FA|nr:glycosyltransferase [Lentibacillus sediminis]